MVVDQLSRHSGCVAQSAQTQPSTKGTQLSLSTLLFAQKKSSSQSLHTQGSLLQSPSFVQSDDLGIVVVVIESQRHQRDRLADGTL